MESPAPALLDQVSSRQLERAATAPAAAGATLALAWRRPRSSAAGAPGLARRIGVFGARAAILALAVVTVAGLAATTVRAVSDADGVSLVDVARLALLVVVLASIAGQARGILPRRASARHNSLDAPPPLILDRIDEETLTREAPPELGAVGLPSLLLHHTRRRVDTILWVVIGVATLVLIGVIVVSLTAGLVGAVQRPPVDLTTWGLGVVLALLGVGWLLVARTFVGTLLNRRRRRRRSALMRLLRYLLQLFRDAAIGGRPPLAAPAIAGVAVMVLAAGIVAGVAFDSNLTAGSGGGAVGSSPGASQAPSIGSAAPLSGGGSASPAHSSSGSSPAPSVGASASPNPVPSPAASAAGTPRPTPTSTPGAPALPTAGPTPTAPPVTLPPKPSPTPPKPTVNPTPTIDPALDSDGDKVPDVVEMQYGSKTNDPLSTPEHKGYDLVFKKTTCSDGFDNDLDGDVDATGKPPEIDPDKGCL